MATPETHYAYTLSNIGLDVCEHLYPMVNLDDLIKWPEIRPNAEPQAVADKLNGLPPGRAAIHHRYLGQPYRYSAQHWNECCIRGHEEDKLPGGHEGWRYLHGMSQLAHMSADYHGQIKELGAPLDFVSVDSEKWRLVRRLTHDEAVALQDDPAARAPGGLIEQLGFEDITSVVGMPEDATRARRLQCGFFRGFWNALHRGGYRPISDLYPGVQFANWFGGYTSSQYATPGRNRLRPCVVGTHAAPACYGTSRAATDAYTACQVDVGDITAHYRSDSGTPIAPWLCGKFGYHASKLESSPYWDELIYHAALLGVQIYQFFNPLTKRPDLYGTEEELAQSAQALDVVLAELNDLRILPGTTCCTPAQTGDVIATAAKSNSGRLWRITVPEGTTHIDYPIDARIPAGQVGTWVHR